MANKKNINPRRPIPAGGYDLLRKNLSSGFADSRNMGSGFPVEKGSFPAPDNRANTNRGRITTRKDDKVKDVSIGLQDHDEAIMFYFNEVIQPSVVINGNRTPVPIVYGAPERWKGVQKDGFYRDKEGKIQTPLIMFKRDRVVKRRDLGNKLDGNNPQLYYTFQEKYTSRNQYDNFSVLQNRKPQKEFHTVVIPDFVKLEYSCIIWCDYVAQMNKLIEMINYTSDSYWGDKNRFKFNAKIDTYDNRTEVSQGDNRIVKTSFGLTIQGYLVPDSLNKELTKKPQKYFSKSTVVFKNEIETDPTGGPGYGMGSPYQLLDNVTTPTDREIIRSKQGNIPTIEGEGVGYEEIEGDVSTTPPPPGIPSDNNVSENTEPVGPIIGGDSDTSGADNSGDPLIIQPSNQATLNLFFHNSMLPGSYLGNGEFEPGGTITLIDSFGVTQGFEVVSKDDYFQYQFLFGILAANVPGGGTGSPGYSLVEGAPLLIQNDATGNILIAPTSTAGKGIATGLENTLNTAGCPINIGVSTSVIGGGVAAQLTLTQVNEGTNGETTVVMDDQFLAYLNTTDLSAGVDETPQTTFSIDIP